MHIDEWAELWSLLSHRYGREPYPDLGERYLDQLERAGLSDEEIRHGVDRVIWSDSDIYGFPSPERIASEARGEASGEEAIEERAVEQEEKVRMMMRNWRKAKPRETLDEIGHRALESVGGIKKLALMDREDVDHVLRRFKKTYRAMASSKVRTEQEGLPPMTDDGRQLIQDAMDGKLVGPGE